MHADAERKIHLMVRAIKALSESIDLALTMDSSAEAMRALDGGVTVGREILRNAKDVKS